MAPKHVLVVDSGGPSEAPGAFELLRDRAPRNAGPLIRAWRQRVGLSQEGLAAAINVTFSTVSRWENGHVMPSKLAWNALGRFATTCGVALDPGEPRIALASTNCGDDAVSPEHALSGTRPPELGDPEPDRGPKTG